MVSQAPTEATVTGSAIRTAFETLCHADGRPPATDSSSIKANATVPVMVKPTTNGSNHATRWCFRSALA